MIWLSWRKSLELTGQTPNGGVEVGGVGGTAGGRGADTENGEAGADGTLLALRRRAADGDQA
jgi:hypothetical protein